MRGAFRPRPLFVLMVW